MAQLDHATKAYASALDDKPQKTILDPLRAAKAVVRFAENPQKTVLRAMVRASMEKDGHLSPLKIFHLLNDHYGESWHDWEPETIWATLERGEGLHPDDALKNVVMALQITASTDYPFEHWHAFEKVGQAFNMNHVDFFAVQPLELNEISWTIYALKLVKPKAVFDHEIMAYIAAAAHDAGVTYLPPELFGSAAQAELAKLAEDHSGIGALTAAAWPSKPGPEGQDVALRIQLARLNEIKNYVKSRL